MPANFQPCSDLRGTQNEGDEERAKRGVHWIRHRGKYDTGKETTILLIVWNMGLG